MINIPPFALLLILLALAAFVRMTLMRTSPSATAGGSIVMAIGIFGQAALQRIPFLPTLVSEILALSLGIIWLFIAASFAIDFMKKRFHVHTQSHIGRFGIGTWIAATVVLARMQMIGVPSWSIALEEAFGLIAALLWVWYMVMVLIGLNAIRRSRERLQANGVILLSTVSTQALALVAIDLSYTPTLKWIDYWAAYQLFHQIAFILILLGVTFYFICLILILQRYWRQKDWTLINNWDSTNCILHGGMSITGVATVLWGTAPFELCLAIWFYAFTVLVVVETLEIVRGILRVKSLGWQEGILTYNVTQWARNFTFGMFYAFTWVLVAHFYALLPPYLADLYQLILGYGAYFVMALLVFQMGLYLNTAIKIGNKTTVESA